jgi:hypothetical protein
MERIGWRPIAGSLNSAAVAGAPKGEAAPEGLRFRFFRANG